MAWLRSLISLMPGPLRAVRAAPALLVIGCALVDQNTFAPAPEAKPVAGLGGQPAEPVRVNSRRALVTIDFRSPAPAFQQLLRYAVQAAEARDANVQYDVIAMVASADAAAQGQADAILVMRALISDGVPARRVHLGLRADPALPARQVRVYVR